tara:strand:+ start:1084 stop:2466 length:1383 start_codon:yes stop_codon:yes gene_type:complete
MRSVEEYQVFPNSKEAEESILGCIMINPELYTVIKDYIPKSDVFYHEKNKIIWKKIVELNKNKSPIDPISIMSKLSSKEKQAVSAYYITGLPDSIPSTANVEHHAQVILERFLKRELIKSSIKIQKGAYENSEEFEKLIKKVKKTTDSLTALSPIKDPSIESIIDETLDSIKTGGNYIRFGYNKLDNLAGGMTKGEVTVIAGRPGHGKTTFSVNLVRNFVKQGHKVLMINREMTNVEMMKKLVVLESGSLSYSDIRANGLDKGGYNELMRVMNVMKTYQDQLIMIDTARDLDSVVTHIARHKPDVVIDDYIQLIKMDGYDQRRFELETVMNEYKWLAKQHQIVPILVSQLNRDIEKRIDPVPKMSDLAESGSIEQVAENVLFVYYDYKVNYENSTLGKNKTQIVAAKVRYGENKKLVFGFDGNKVSFIENVDETVNSIDELDDDEAKEFMKRIERFGSIK